MKRNKGDNSPIYRYITFEKAILLSGHGFYVPAASAFEDINEGRLDFVPHYLEEEVNEKIRYFRSEIESIGYIKEKLAPVFGILAKAVYDFKQRHSCSSRCLVTEQRLLKTAEKICSSKHEIQQDRYVREIFEDLAKEDCRGALVSCWTKTEEESYALWRAYSGENGVRIKTSVKKFRDFASAKELHVTPSEGSDSEIITIPFQIHGDYVKYRDFLEKSKKEQLREYTKFNLYKEILFSKLKTYRAEEEYRFLLFSDEWESLKSSGKIVPNSGALFKCEFPESFLDEIQISPFGTDSEKHSRERILKKMFPGIPVRRSNLDIGQQDAD